MKSSYLNEFRDSQNFLVFQGDGCPVNPKNKNLKKILEAVK